MTRKRHTERSYSSKTPTKEKSEWSVAFASATSASVGRSCMQATDPLGNSEGSLWISMRTWQPAFNSANSSSLLAGVIKGQSCWWFAYADRILCSGSRSMLTALPPTLPRKPPNPSCAPKGLRLGRMILGQYSTRSSAIPFSVDSMSQIKSCGMLGQVNGVCKKTFAKDVPHFDTCNQYKACLSLLAGNPARTNPSFMCVLLNGGCTPPNGKPAVCNRAN
mmetsp:Transcript_63689/g.168652  ORF Transcript_63689/g.168652 Transcript_63689/m.168652 type:complete len:220 (+) Transcript_63689:312-971(+)